ncbi:MAG: phosphoglycerate dehydrogenase [Opitutales bacterium]
MPVRVLLSTTSYQDTPGPHHELLASLGVELVRERGPLSESRMRELAGDLDAFLCGDDVISRSVLEKASPRLKMVSKYGIGVDKIDVATCTEMGIPVSFCPGVNHTTVAEHTFALMLALFRHLVDEVNFVRGGQWKRLTGREVRGKTIGIVGLGRIGREVAKRAAAFGLKVMAFDRFWPEAFAAEVGITQQEDISALLRDSDIVSLHVNLADNTREMIRGETIDGMRDGAILLNCARGELVNSTDVAAALHSGKLGGYGADVLDKEPPSNDHPLLTAPRCIVTPHIGSRTFESVERQALMATQNLANMLKGDKPLAQVNDVPIPQLST